MDTIIFLEQVAGHVHHRSVSKMITQLSQQVKKAFLKTDKNKLVTELSSQEYFANAFGVFQEHHG